MKNLVVAGICGTLLAACAQGDIVLENARLRLTLGEDAVVKSLKVKPSKAPWSAYSVYCVFFWKASLSS